MGGRNVMQEKRKLNDNTNETSPPPFFLVMRIGMLEAGNQH
jgi:hypothetical protein